MRGGFERLEVYRLAEGLADRLWEIGRGWPPRVWDTVGRQLVRAADSVGANIAEGSGRGTFVDNRRFVVMARGSFEETRHWLRRAFQRNLINEEQASELSTAVRLLGPKLNAFLNSIPRSNTPRKRTAGIKPKATSTE